MRKRPLFFSLCLVISLSLSGCATYDAWKAAEQTDFGREGAVLGSLSLGGSHPYGWNFYGIYLYNPRTGKKHNVRFDYGGAFFVNVSPGEYVFRLNYLQNQEYGYAIKTSSVHLDFESTPFEVRTGEVVYIGNLSVQVGKPSDLIIKDFADRIDAFLGVRQERKIRVGYSVSDKGHENSIFLKHKRPQGDYRFVTRLMKVKGDQSAKESSRREGLPFGFKDTGIAKEAKATLTSYKVSGQGGQFSKDVGVITWFADLDMSEYAYGTAVNYTPPAFTVEWYAPDGERFAEQSNISPEYGKSFIRSELMIPENLEDYIVGTWHVKIKNDNGRVIDHRSFKIV